ncbi:ribonuclease family protein [Mycobacteroides abscessus]|nr:ribonuclease family protein [Mycobacteroides abscessus]
MIVACFASNVARVQQIIDASVAHGRRVALVGRSMVRNMGIARELGFLEVDDRDLINVEAANELAPQRVVLITPAPRANRWPHCRGWRVVITARSR